MDSGYMKQIRERVLSAENGMVFTTSDFADIADSDTVRQSLNRLVNSGILRRVFRGVFEKPKYSKLLHEYVAADPDAVAKAISYATSGDKLYEAVVSVTEVIPGKEEFFDLYKEKVPALADLVSYLDTSTAFSYPTQSKKFADSLINLMQETLFDETSEVTGQDIVDQLAEEFGA